MVEKSSSPHQSRSTFVHAKNCVLLVICSSSGFLLGDLYKLEYLGTMPRAVSSQLPLRDGILCHNVHSLYTFSLRFLIRKGEPTIIQSCSSTKVIESSHCRGILYGLFFDEIGMTENRITLSRHIPGTISSAWSEEIGR